MCLLQIFISKLIIALEVIRNSKFTCPFTYKMLYLRTWRLVIFKYLLRVKSLVIKNTTCLLAFCFFFFFCDPLFVLYTVHFSAVFSVLFIFGFLYFGLWLVLRRLTTKFVCFTRLPSLSHMLSSSLPCILRCANNNRQVLLTRHFVFMYVMLYVKRLQWDGRLKDVV